MPNLGHFHPQLVQFVIVGAGIGIFFRWVSLTGKLKWSDGAATALILIGTVAAYFAVRSETDAHGVAERVPGAVRVVQQHGEEGKELLNMLYVIAALELAFLIPALATWRKYVVIASAVVGLWGAYEIFETGQAGGELVYSYAGGVGVRSGDTTDVNRLVMAAMYHRAALSRTQKNDAAAAAAYPALAAQFPKTRRRRSWAPSR